MKKESHRVERLEHYLGHSINVEQLPPQSLIGEPAYKAPMATLQIDGAKKRKVIPGENGINSKQVAKINNSDNFAYVAVSINAVKPTLKKLTNGKLKCR